MPIKAPNLKNIFVAENVFVILALIFGLIFAFKTAPFHGPDEAAHFFRVYQISKLQLTPLKVDVEQHSEGHAVIPFNMGTAINSYSAPENLGARLPKDNLNFELDESEMLEVDISTTAVYSPVAYLIQAVGLGVASIFTKNVLMLSYLLRYFSLFTYIALVYLAIRQLKTLKWFMFFMALLPVCIAQAALLNVGAMAFGLIFLFLAYVISIITRKEKVTIKEQFTLGALALAITLTNFAYFPLIFILLATYQKWGGVRRTLVSLALILGVSCAALLMWSHLVGDIRPLGPSMNSDNYDTQLLLLKQSPQYFWERFSNTFFSRLGHVWPLRTVGGTFDWAIPIRIAKPIGYAILITLPLLAFLNGSGKVSVINRVLPVLVTATNLIFISVIYYLTHMKVGDRAIAGLQGRYFTPLLLLLSIMFINNVGSKYKNIFKYVDIAVPILSIAMAVIGLLALATA